MEKEEKHADQENGTEEQSTEAKSYAVQPQGICFTRSCALLDLSLHHPSVGDAVV